jgi:deoxyribodipyrimidine photo-lyase
MAGDVAGAQDAGTWLNELLWREFYIHVLAEFPRVAMHQPLRRETAALPWRNSPEEFAHWCAGRTGYPAPMVDLAFARGRALDAFAGIGASAVR